MVQDKARKRTDKILKRIERDVGIVYKDSPQLLRAKKKFDDYMDMVARQTRPAYQAYLRETDSEEKERLKKEYVSQVKAFTSESKSYKRLVTDFIIALTKANQEAVEVVNNAMPEVFSINYNQVAEECKRVGIKVK